MVSKSCVQIRNNVTEFINSLSTYLVGTVDPILLNNHPIHCLLIYAENIVLLSKSAEGLQEKMDSLTQFCNNWCIYININHSCIQQGRPS